MLNHTYTSVKNANLVDCGKKQHIPSQPTPLLKENFLGEFRTELDKKKVLAALGIATELSLEWENIKGDIGRSDELMKALDSRTTYTTKIGEFKDKVISIVQGIEELESIVGGEQEDEDAQNQRLTDLEALTKDLIKDLGKVEDSLSNISEVDIAGLEKDLEEITKKVDNITDLIQVSSKNKNALHLEEGETPGLYVQDLSDEVYKATKDIGTLRADVDIVLGSYVTKDALGGGDFNFVNQGDFDGYASATGKELGDIKKDLANTVKTDGEGKVNTLSVNVIKKNNSEGNNIQIENSFEMKSGIPLDVRFVVSTRSDLAKLKVGVCYAGMGVIVKDESALYILREPSDGKLTQGFIEDINVNWKCPEDLVTQALTREEYEALLVIDPETGKNKINPTKFYYIYEEPITSTQEPVRKQDETDEKWQERWNDWVRSLKILSQEYMSASWGVDVEKKLGKTASSADLNALNSNLKQLQTDLENIKGGEAANSLASLGKNIKEIQDAADKLEARLDVLVDVNEAGTESGRIVDLEKNVEGVANSLGDYVTRKELQTDTSEDFIFVKTSDLTKGIKTESIETDSLSLNNANIEVAENHLKIYGKPIALSEDLMQVEVIDQDTYNQREKAGDLSNNVYYYTYDGTVSLVTNNDLDGVKQELQDLRLLVGQLQQTVLNLQQLVPGSN